MNQIEKAQIILGKIEGLAALSHAPRADRPYHVIASKLREVYFDLIPPTETAVDNFTLTWNSSEVYLRNNFDQILDTVSMLRFPGTNDQLFQRGGSYSLFDINGSLIDFVEERVGEVYEGNKHNAAAFTATKPSVLYALHALGRTMDISNSSNTDTIHRILWPDPKDADKFVHNGGLLVNLPNSLPGIKERKMVMGISSVELTPEALQHVVDTFIAAGAEDSLDHSTDNDDIFKPYHFTTAGTWDETAGLTVEQLLNGQGLEKMQALVDNRWALIKNLATAPHLKPLGPQFH